MENNFLIKKKRRLLYKDAIWVKECGGHISEIGIEVYVDDMVIKSKGDDNFWRDIEDTLKQMRRTNMKLNPN